MAAKIKIKLPITRWCAISSWVCSLTVHLICYFLQTAQQAVSFKHHRVLKLIYFSILISNFYTGATTIIKTVTRMFLTGTHKDTNNVYLCLALKIRTRRYE